MSYEIKIKDIVDLLVINNYIIKPDLVNNLRYKFAFYK